MEVKGDTPIEFHKTVIDDGGLVTDALAFYFPRGEDGQGTKQAFIVDSRVTDEDLIPIRDKIKRCLNGEERCIRCGWPVEMDNPLFMYSNGTRGGFTCFCTYMEGK